MTRRKLLRVLPRPDKLESSSLFEYLNCKWLTIQENYHIADPNLLPYLAHLSNDILVVLNKSKLHTTYFIYFSYICGGLGAAAPKLHHKTKMLHYDVKIYQLKICLFIYDIIISAMQTMATCYDITVSIVYKYGHKFWSAIWLFFRLFSSTLDKGT